MAGFGAKVKLSVDRSGAAKAAFNEQINSLTNQIKISNKFVVLQKDMDRVRTSAQTMLNKSPIKIKNIDCSQAVTKLRSDLQNVINSLSIKNGVSITGLVDPTGAGTITTQIDNIADAAARGQNEVNRFNAQMSVLKTTMSSLATAYKSVLPGGKNAITDTTQLNALTQRYIALKQKIEEIRNANGIASQERVAELQNEAVAIQDEIAKINQERVAREQSAAAAKQAEKAAKDTAANKARAEAEYRSQLDKVNSLLIQTKKNLDSWSASKTGKTSGEYRNIQKYIAELENLRFRIQLSGEAVKDFGSKFGEIKTNIDTSSTAIKEAGENTKTFADRVGGLASKFTSWLTVSQVVMQVYRAIKKMVSVVAEVDTAMTELRKVTDETEATYSKFLDTAAVRAKAIGATISDTVNATADFARLGYSIVDASVLADAAIIYKNVGDGIEDVSQASESIISTMKAFGVEAADVMTIVDKFNIVGNEFAISSTGIGEALLNSASALAAAGNTLDESIALITAANEVIQNPEKVGTALKTVSMYIRAAKTEAEDAGIATDGMANSVSELREEILALTGNKVDIMLDENTFKSTVQVVRELSTVWDDLTDITRTNITELIGGGVRNANIISALINNFGTVENVIGTAADSAGSALAENEKYLDSIAGKASEFKATFEELSITLIDSESVKQIVDFGTGLLKVLNAVAKVVDAVGGLNNVLIATVGILTAIKLESIKKKLSDFSSSIATTGASFLSLLGKIKDLPLAMKIAKEEGQGLSAALDLVGISASAAQLAIGALTAVVTIAIAIYQHHQQKLQEQKDAAIDAANALNETSASVEEYKAKAVELRAAIDSGNLSEKEAYDKRKELMSIQESLIEMFGKEAAGIDLVTGSIEAQIDAINALTEAEWHEYKQENTKAIENAVDLFTIDNDTNGILHPEVYFKNMGRKEAAELFRDKMEELDLGSYFTEVFDESTQTTGFRINTDSIYDMLELLRAEYDIVEAIGKEQDIDVGSELESLSKQITKIKDKISGSEDIFNTYVEGLLQYDTTYSEVWGNIITQQKKYNDAILNGDEKAADAALTAMNELKNGLGEGFSEGVNSEAVNLYLDQFFDEWDTSTQNRALKLKVKTELESDDSNLQKALDSFAKGQDLADISAIKNGGKTKNQVESYQELCDIAEEYETDVDGLCQALLELGYIQDATGESAAKEAASLSSLTDVMTNIEAAYSAMSASTTGLTSDATEAIETLYSSLEGYDAGELFEHTTTGIYLNAEALQKLEKEYQNLKKEEIDSTLEELANEYAALTEEINNYQLILGSTDQISDLYAQRDSVLQKINDAKDLATQYYSLTSAYNSWLRAQSQSDAREGYSNVAQGYSEIEDLISQGWYTSEDVTKYLDMMLGTDRIEDNVAAFETLKEAIEGTSFSIMDFFQYDDDNNLVTDGLYNFLDAVHDVLGDDYVKQLENGGYEFDFSGDKINEVADALGMSVELIQIMERAMTETGFAVNFDSMFSGIDDIINGAKDAVTVLKELQEAGQIENNADWFDISTDDLDDITEQIEQAKKLVAEFKSEDGTVDTALNGASEAEAVLAALIYKKSALEAPAVMSIEVDDEMAETEIGKVILLMQQLKNARAELDTRIEVGADTTEAQANVDRLFGELKQLGLDGNSAFIQLGIDTTSVDAAIADINALTPDQLVNIGVDTTEVDGYEPGDKTSTVHFTPSHSAVDSYINYLNNLQLRKTITLNYAVTGNTGTMPWAQAEGTAHADGTAMARGDWRTKDSGVALGGELGQELVVRDGRYFTIGDNAAEFFRFKRGDIIFNADQTRQIFQNGKITSGRKRGTTYAEGTAFDSGSGGRRRQSYTTNWTSSSTSSSSSSSSGSSSSSSSSSSSDDDDNSEIVDWIEIAIKRIERAIDRIATVATSPFRKLAERLDATNDEISGLTYEISMQEAGYNRYMQQANSVGLSSDLRSRVQDGTIDINEYDSDTAELIKDFQEFYEKALDCSDAILELKESLAELHQEKFDDVASEYENQLSLLEHLTTTYNNGLDDLEERGYLASTKYYEALREVELKNIDVRQEELTALIQEMSDAVNSGSIAEGSEAWYEFQQEINSTREAIQESETAMVKFGNSIREIEWERFDYLQTQISAVADEADFLIDLMEDAKQYTDNGQLTNIGMAAMGLHGQNYNVYMAQADRYAQQVKELNAEIANDPNNTKLLERREELLQSQRESILAAEDEKQAIVDMVQEGIELELDALQELITSYTDALDSVKDLYDYQKKIKDQTSEIAQLQKQIAAYSGDNSEETRATVQKLQVSLSDAMEDLEETQYEHYISEQKKLLDDLYDEYESVLNQRLDDVDALINDMIQSINANSASISDTIADEAEAVGYTLSESMREIWTNEGGAYSIIAKYGDSFTTALTSINNVLGSISAHLAAMIGVSDEEASTTIDSTTSTTDTLAPPPAPEPEPEPEPTPTPAPVVEEPSLSDEDYYGVALAIWNGGYGWGTGSTRSSRLSEKGFDVDYVNSILNQMWRDGYVRSGAWVGRYYGIRDLSPYHYNRYLKGGLVDYTGLAQLDGTPSNPEMVLDSTDTANLIELKEALRLIAAGNSPLSRLFGDGSASALVLERLAASNGAGIMATPNAGNFIFNVNIPIERVLDYEDFMNQMRKDGRFEKFIQSMTIDRMVGGSRLAKNKYQW